MSKEELINDKFEIQQNGYEEGNNLTSLEIQDLVLTILERARKSAENIKDKAKVEGYQEGLEKGYRKGYEDGYQKGYEEGLRYFEKEIENIKRLGEKILDERYRLFEEYKYEMVQMALEISKKLIFTELLLNPEIILNIITNAISLMKEKESIRIIVNPKLLGLISDKSLSALGVSKIELVSDEKLDEGDVVIISPGEQVEFRLKERFKEIDESFRSIFASSSRL